LSLIKNISLLHFCYVNPSVQTFLNFASVGEWWYRPSESSSWTYYQNQ